MLGGEQEGGQSLFVWAEERFLGEDFSGDLVEVSVLCGEVDWGVAPDVFFAVASWVDGGQ
jgi:hypothetical protein